MFFLTAWVDAKVKSTLAQNVEIIWVKMTRVAHKFVATHALLQFVVVALMEVALESAVMDVEIVILVDVLNAVSTKCVTV